MNNIDNKKIKKQSVILFFHGYGSSVNTDKYTDIPYTTKKAIQIDYDMGLKHVIETVTPFVLENMEEYDEVLLMGHSMGGYVAAYMSAKYDQPCILLAPCIHPELTKPSICDLGIDVLPYTNNKLIAIVESGDEIIDNDLVIEYLKGGGDNYTIELLDGGHHRTNRNKCGEIGLSIYEISCAYPLVGMH